MPTPQQQFDQIGTRRAVADRRPGRHVEPGVRASRTPPQRWMMRRATRPHRCQPRRRASAAASPVSHAGRAWPNSAPLPRTHAWRGRSSRPARHRGRWHVCQERRNRVRAAAERRAGVANRCEVAGDQAEHAEDGLAGPQRSGWHARSARSRVRRAQSRAPRPPAPGPLARERPSPRRRGRDRPCRGRGAAPASRRPRASGPSADQSGNTASCPWSPVNVADNGTLPIEGVEEAVEGARCRRSGVPDADAATRVAASPIDVPGTSARRR